MTETKSARESLTAPLRVIVRALADFAVVLVAFACTSAVYWIISKTSLPFPSWVLHFVETVTNGALVTLLVSFSVKTLVNTWQAIRNPHWERRDSSDKEHSDG